MEEIDRLRSLSLTKLRSAASQGSTIDAAREAQRLDDLDNFAKLPTTLINATLNAIKPASL